MNEAAHKHGAACEFDSRPVHGRLVKEVLLAWLIALQGAQGVQETRRSVKSSERGSLQFNLEKGSPGTESRPTTRFSATVQGVGQWHLELLRRVESFGASLYDMKPIYYLFVQSLLGQLATVWHSSLTDDYSTNLERVKKSAVKIMLGAHYNV